MISSAQDEISIEDAIEVLVEYTNKNLLKFLGCPRANTKVQEMMPCLHNQDFYTNLFFDLNLGSLCEAKLEAIDKKFLLHL